MKRLMMLALILATCAGCANGNPFYVPPEYRDTSAPAAYVPRSPVYTIPGGATYQQITPFYSIPYEAPR